MWTPASDARSKGDTSGGCLQIGIGKKWSASAGTRTRVQALATPGDNHYTTLAGDSPDRAGV